MEHRQRARERDQLLRREVAKVLGAFLRLGEQIDRRLLVDIGVDATASLLLQRWVDVEVDGVGGAAASSASNRAAASVRMLPRTASSSTASPGAAPLGGD